MGQRYTSSEGYRWGYAKVDGLCDFLKSHGFISQGTWDQRKKLPGMGTRFTWGYRNSFTHKETSCTFGVYLTGFGFEIIAIENHPHVFYQTVPWTTPKSTFDKILNGLDKCLTEAKAIDEALIKYRTKCESKQEVTNEV